MIPPLRHVADMSAYVVAPVELPDGVEPHWLNLNESLRGPSPRVDAVRLERPELYADGDWTALRGGLADTYGVEAGQILCAPGSIELIAAIARAYCGPGNAVLAPAHAYPFFANAAAMAGARYDRAEEVGLTASVDHLLAAVRPDTRVVFLANPANPTGTYLPLSEVERLRAGLRDDILLVVDEAYGEFADHLGGAAFHLVSGGRTCVLRTFSKAYGLAGLRVGWGVFPPAVAAEVVKVQPPGSLSGFAQAVAKAALDDQDYMRETCALTITRRDVLAARLRQGGYDIPESFTNFVLVPFADAAAAARADAALRDHGFVLRPQHGPGLPHCLRVTIGAATVMDQVAAVLNGLSLGERP